MDDLPVFCWLAGVLLPVVLECFVELFECFGLLCGEHVIVV